MDILKKIASLLLCTILIFSCKIAKNIPIIDLSKIDKSISLNLSDILMDISAVQISADYLFSVDDPIFVTSKYLIIYMNRYGNQSSLHLFSRGGEHIRKLTEEGSGPGEFYFIEDFFVDEEDEILYYTDMKDRTRLFRIDIRNGKALEPLQIDFTYLTTKYLNGKVYSFPNYGGGSFDQTSEYIDSSIVVSSTTLPSGEIKKYKGCHNYPFIVLGSTITSYFDEITLVNLGYSDTLFNLKEDKLKPLCILHLTNKMLDYEQGGSTVQLISAYHNGIVLSKNNVTYKVDERGQILIYTTEYYVLYDRKGAVYKIDNIDVLNTKISLTNLDNFQEFSTFPVSCGRYGYMVVEHDVLETLSADYDKDNDNPFIIIGVLK